MPRVLGVLLILAGVAYVGSSVADLVSPAATMVMFHLSALLGGVGEGATILWLIIVGATARR